MTALVTRRRVRDETCASCRGAAVYGVTRPDGSGLTSACWRHVETWMRRLAENAEPGGSDRD